MQKAAGQSVWRGERESPQWSINAQALVPRVHSIPPETWAHTLSYYPAFRDLLFRTPDSAPECRILQPRFPLVDA